MSGIYNIGLFVVAFRTGSSGQVLVFFYTHNDNSTCQYSPCAVINLDRNKPLNQIACLSIFKINKMPKNMNSVMFLISSF